jgi:hypothetical protein
MILFMLAMISCKDDSTSPNEIEKHCSAIIANDTFKIVPSENNPSIIYKKIDKTLDIYVDFEKQAGETKYVYKLKIFLINFDGIGTYNIAGESVSAVWLEIYSYVGETETSYTYYSSNFLDTQAGTVNITKFDEVNKIIQGNTTVQVSDQQSNSIVNITGCSFYFSY